MFSKGGSSDPFVTFVIKNGQAAKPLKSTVQKRTTTPCWGDGSFDPGTSGEHFVLQVEGGAGATIAGGETCLVKVFDFDLLGASDFMGKLEIPLAHFEDKRRSRKWYTLTDEDGAIDPVKPRGAVELRVWWKHNPNVAALTEMELVDDEHSEDGGGGVGGGEHVAEGTNEVSEKPVNEVLVAVVRARRLPAVDNSLLGKASSDPVVVMEIEGEMQQSSVKSNALWPVWRERFAFPVHHSRLRLATIKIEVCARTANPTPPHRVPYAVSTSTGKH